ncbi:Zn(II)2Cys6 transcription factor [Aspergillus melleus]|uniref:Zn(II)2Cys6 transcription factor n=1 Tax=Aspergillus melleus TaxID=138277 RepID=UPI001E8DC71F|nr:uncharacterized protein LDX57_000116 [Aspergillus melleus]KAH8422360.1 hypothetical protein LDX57_000116 [Aspergillus melleus]
MPRPKVSPANRLRAYEVCLACRVTKKRCSGSFPCVACIKNDRADTCTPCKRKDRYASPRLSRDNRGGLSSTTVSVSESSGARSLPVTGSHRSSDTSRPDRHVTPHESPNAVVDPGSPEAPHKTHPRMLRNLQGERVFIGKAASLSFLQLLRDTVTQYIGPSQFSHNVRSEDMLETETPRDIPVSIGDVDSDQQTAFIANYHIATSGFIHILSDAELSEILSEPLQSPNNSPSAHRALRDIMTAIGAQSYRSSPETIQAERFFFARGQRSAFDNMIENPSLELVRVFLLMSFYMLGACRRNAAFMYIGIAARAAAALGLHLNDSSDATPASERRRRARVWMSLCILDLLVSSILGRPPATTILRSDRPGNQSNAGKKDYYIEASLLASFHMSQILDEIIVRLYSDKAASAETAESLLGKLKGWSENLPESLRTPPPIDSEPFAAQERIIGCLHIACSYHFAVIIITRPFLISALGVRLARLQRPSEVAMQEALQEDPAHSRLAGACTDSALYMIQTCMEVHQSGLLLGNMCILKAFVFAAALVLGFSMFSQNHTDSILDEAFNGAIEILHTLSQQSAQAAHYYEILTFLRNAIEQRRRLLQQTQQNNSPYVSKLFSLNQPRDQADAGNNAPIPASGSSDMTIPNGALDMWSLMDPAELSSTLPAWDGMDLPLWDSFPFAAAGFQLPDRMNDASLTL